MKSDLLKLLKESDNIVEALDEEMIRRISSKVSEGFEYDLQTMAKWLKNTKDAVKLVSLEMEPESDPPRANIKYPLITEACIQFAANTYPEIVKDGEVVKTNVIGSDFSNSKVDRGNRVSDYMNYQLLSKNSDWEQGLDRLLNLLPNIGCLFKKTYYDPIKKDSVSELCNFTDIILDNTCMSLKNIRRITHILKLPLNDLVEGARLGIYCEDEVQKIYEKLENQELKPLIEILEQHRFLDLDEDGYEEPYIVTQERDTGCILRIVARYDEKGIQENKKGVYCIQEKQYFTDYHFLPNPNGSFMSVGFGTLMLHLNITINTVLNQLIDAGKLSNFQGGYIDSRIKLPTGDSNHKRGEWIKATPAMGQELQSGFVPINYKEPSQVLLQLLTMLIQAGKELSSSTGIMNGQVMPDNAKTGAVSSILERGLKVFTSIQRRFYRSLKDELQKIFVLDSEFLDEVTYYTVLDDSKAIQKQDFNLEDLDIQPVADPNLSSDSQRMNQIQIMQSIKGEPGVNNHEINMRTLQFARVSNPEQILPPPPAQQPPPLQILQFQAENMHAQAANANKQEMLKQKAREITLQEQKADSEIKLTLATALNQLSSAEATSKGTSLDDLELGLAGMQTKIDAIMQLHQMQHQKDMQTQSLAAQQQQNQQPEQTPVQQQGVPTDGQQQPNALAQPLGGASNVPASPPNPPGTPPGQ